MQFSRKKEIKMYFEDFEIGYKIDIPSCKIDNSEMIVKCREYER